MRSVIEENAADFNADEQPAPRTLTVLGLLSMTALIFSYLGSYAVADALVSAEIVKRWPASADPRPLWMVSGFFVLMFAFMGIAAVFRWLSIRQLKAIDAMEAEG
jgi:hypothetical protein